VISNVPSLIDPSIAIHRFHAEGLSGIGSSPASESSEATSALSFADDRGGLGIHQITTAGLFSF
jgi:hypothetical protein